MGIEIIETDFPAQESCKRILPRKRELAAALLAPNDQAAPLDCLIRDITQAGAQIRVSRATPIPEQGYLIDLKSGTAWTIQTVWRRGSLTGLRFLREFAINNALPAHMEFLVRLYLEGKKRQSISRTLDPLRFR